MRRSISARAQPDYPTRVLRAAVILALLLLTGCTSLPTTTANPASDIDQGAALLQEYGWQPIGVLSRDVVRIGDPALVPEHVWDLYSEASLDVDLELGPLRGREATLTRVELGGPQASILSIGGTVVGAWIYAGGRLGCVPGIFPLSAPRAEVEACAGEG